jgi:hypothetical protein
VSIISNTLRLWFGIGDSTSTPVTEPEATPAGRYTALQEASGSLDKDVELKLKIRKRLPPRCIGCKRFMGKNEGMHIYIDESWKLHIKCFANVIDQHIAKGELLDLTTCGIHKLVEGYDI